MQQARRISDNALAFFLMGELVEHNETSVIFSEPKDDDRTKGYVNGDFG